VRARRHPLPRRWQRPHRLPCRRRARSRCRAPPADEGPGRSQKPLEILTAPDAAFQVDYGNSEAKTTAVEHCVKESKGDAEKQGACIT
jgi:hypothetical protein